MVKYQKNGEVFCECLRPEEVFKAFSPLLCTWAALSKEKEQQTYMKYEQIQARDGRGVKEVTSVAAK